MWIDSRNTSKWQSGHWSPSEESILDSVKSFGIRAGILRDSLSLIQPQKPLCSCLAHSTSSPASSLASAWSLALSSSPGSPSVCWMLKQWLAVSEHCNETCSLKRPHQENTYLYRDTDHKEMEDRCLFRRKIFRWTLHRQIIRTLNYSWKYELQTRPIQNLLLRFSTHRIVICTYTHISSI